MANTPRSLGRGYYAYTSDDGNIYDIATTVQNAAAQGVTDKVLPGSHPPFPRGWKMRSIYGEDPLTGTRTKIPIFSPTHDLWKESTLTFVKDTVTYVTEGLKGECRFYRGG